MKIHELTKQLVMLRRKKNEIAEAGLKVRAEIDSIQRTVMEEMSEMELKSFKNEDVTVSKAIRKTLQIIDEKELISDLDRQGLKGEYVSEQVIKDLWKGLSTELVKNNKMFAGTELKETEFLSIRTNK